MANPNPSPATRFKPGHALGGKTSEQRRMEYEAAEIAAKARLRLISIIGKAIDAVDDGSMTIEEAHKLFTADTLRLFKDSEDRAHGTARQAVEHTGENGGPITFVWVDPNAAPSD